MKLTGHAFKRDSIVLLNGKPIDKKEDKNGKIQR